MALPAVPVFGGARRNLIARRPRQIARRARFNCNKFEARIAPTWQPIFEGGDNMMPVAAESTMIAVVKHHDVALRAARTRCSRQPGDQSLRRLRLPIPSNPRPHHHALHSGPLNFRLQQRRAVTIGRPHPARRIRMGGLGNRALATLQFVAQSRSRLKYQVCMRVGVIAEQMPARQNFLNQLRTFPNKFSNQKKSRAHGMPVEQFEKARGDGRIWAIIKCKSNSLCRIRMTHGGTIHLRRGSDSSPGGAARYRHRASHHGPWIQFDSNPIDSRTSASLFLIFVAGCTPWIIFTAGLTLVIVGITGHYRSASTSRPAGSV